MESLVGNQVLLVEDDPVIQRAVVRAAAGVVHVIVAGTGQAGLDRLDAAAPPCVVILDYALPDTDGLQVLRALRARPGLRDVPVILFSSMRDPRLRAEALAAGATAWVDKPDDPAELREVVRGLCARFGHGRGAQS